MNTEANQWWLYNLGRRLWLAGELILYPLKIVALLLEIALGIGFIAVIVVVIAFWKGDIPQADIINFVNSVGSQGLSILKAQHVYASH